MMLDQSQVAINWSLTQKNLSLTPDGIPGPATFGELVSTVTPEAPDAVAHWLAANWKKYELATPARLAEFIAQTSYESSGYTHLEEDLDYSIARIMQVWPQRFPLAAAAQDVAHNPRALANAVYNGRMGNRTGTNDGWNYRGRGCIQITGRTNYTIYSRATGLDLVNIPYQAATFPAALDIAGAFWKATCINTLVDGQAYTRARVRVNGGTNGVLEVSQLRTQIMKALV